MSTTTYRRALIELADLNTYQGGRKTGGLLSIGSIDHGLGNEQGTFSASRTQVQYSDKVDRLYRTLLETEELEQDQVRVKAASPARRAAGGDPLVLSRAKVQSTGLESPLVATVNGVDTLFADYGPFGPSRVFPPLIPQFTQVSATPADVLKQVMPWLLGEKTDNGATDPATGTVVEKGCCPLKLLGQETISRTTQTSGAFPWDGRNGPDVLENAATVTIPGTTWGAPVPFDAFQVALLVPDSNPSGYKMSGVILDDNSLMQAGQFISFDGVTPGSAPYDQRVVSKIWSTTPIPTGTKILVLKMPIDSKFNPITNPFAFTPGEIRYKIEDLTVTNPDGPPHVNVTDPPVSGYYTYQSDWTGVMDGSEWPPAPGATVTQGEVWDAYLAFGIPISQITGVYGSDLGNGDATMKHDRVKLDPDSRQDILVPGFAAWPFTDLFRDYTDANGTTYRCTVIYAKGALSDDHKNGVVNLAVNAIGPETVGDCTGLPIIDLEDCKQHLIENGLLNRYTSGLWCDNTTCPKWEDGTPMVRSSAFRATQNFYAARYGGRGLTANWYLDKQYSIAELWRMMNCAGDAKLGTNSHGQIVDFVLDETQATSTWPTLRHETDFFGTIQQQRGESRENVESGSYSFDPDAQRFRAGPVTIKSTTGIATYKGNEKQGNPGDNDSQILDDPNQYLWSLNRRLTRLKTGIITATVTGKMGLWDTKYQVGNGVLVNSIEGTSAVGWVNRPFIILRRKMNLSEKPITVTLTLWDVANVMADYLYPRGSAQLFFLDDETGSPRPLGDETAVPSTALVLV